MAEEKICKKCGNKITEGFKCGGCNEYICLSCVDLKGENNYCPLCKYNLTFFDFLR